jgi:hypothetical protein
MARLGINVSDVQDTIEIAIGGKSAGKVFEGDRRFDLIVRLPDNIRKDVELLKKIPIPLPQKNSHTISGSVESTDGKQIEYATVKLINPTDSSLIGAMYADSLGTFSFSAIDCSLPFVLKVSHIGYLTLILPPFTSIKCDDLNVGTLELLLDTSIDLEEVKVTAQIDVLKAGIDKKVYNVGEDISVKGGTGNDVLNRLPSVEVDEDGGVTLRGDGSVIILINGRPSSLSGGNGKTLLDALPAGSIERVEIVTNPSARYDPDGTSGIINIVLKKNKLKGFNGSLSILGPLPLLSCASRVFSVCIFSSLKISISILF